MIHSCEIEGSISSIKIYSVPEYEVTVTRVCRISGCFFCMNIFLLVLVQSLWTIIMHNPESMSSDIVDLSHVLTLLRVFNDNSTVQVVASRVKNLIIASRTAGNKSIFFTKSTKSDLNLFNGFHLAHFVPWHCLLFKMIYLIKLVDGLYPWQCTLFNFRPFLHCVTIVPAIVSASILSSTVNPWKSSHMTIFSSPRNLSPIDSCSVSKISAVSSA